MSTNESVSKLLKLKRHEQPPEGYFEDFLREFQDRQRSEIHQRSLWEIISDRMASLMPSFEVPRMAYAAIAVMAVVATTAIVTQPSPEAPGMLAKNESLSLSSPQSVSIGDSRAVALTSTGSPSVHYVLPTRPVSYASARSF